MSTMTMTIDAAAELLATWPHALPRRRRKAGSNRETTHRYMSFRCSLLSKYDFPGVGTERCASTAFTTLNCVMAASFHADVYRTSFFARSRGNLASKSRRRRENEPPRYRRRGGCMMERRSATTTTWTWLGGHAMLTPLSLIPSDRNSDRRASTDSIRSMHVQFTITM